MTECLSDSDSGFPQDVWEVWLAEGTSIEIRLDRLDDGGSADLDLKVSLLDPDLTVVSTGDDTVPCSAPSPCGTDCPTISHTAAMDGLYRFEVRDECHTAAGAG